MEQVYFYIPRIFEFETLTSKLPQLVIMELGRFHTIPISSPPEDLEPKRVLHLPIVPNKRIIVNLDYNGEIKLQSYYRFTESTSFPIANILFNELNQKSGKPYYRFEVGYTKIGRLPSLEKVIESTSENIKEKYNHHSEDFEKDLAEQHKKSSLNETLFDVHSFIDEISSGKRYDSSQVTNIEYLLKCYQRNKKIPDKCTSISTFTKGLANALGLSARRISGYILDIMDNVNKLDTEESIYMQILGILGVSKRYNFIAGHSWTEIYIPSRKEGEWFLIDPALRNFRNYPSKKPLYVAECLLPKFLEPSVESARLMVDYR